MVVGCGVRVQSHGYNGTSVEIMGMYPLTYAMPIAGGHAVMVRTLPLVDKYQMCEGGGTSANGAVPPDWVPMIAWYDKAEDLSHGIGYATLDAYANPHSQLEYHGARVEAATRRDFDRFMATKPPNLVPAYNAGWMSVLDRPRIPGPDQIPKEIAANPRMAWKLEDWPRCRGVRRIKLDVHQRELVRRHWPADRPRIWTLADWQAQVDLKKRLMPRAGATDFIGYASPERGSYVVRGPRPEVYPTSIDYGLDRLDNETGKDGVYYHDSFIGDGIADRGFVFCDSQASYDLESGVTGRKFAARSKIVCRIDGVAIPTPACELTGWIAFVNDEYAIIAIDEFFI